MNPIKSPLITGALGSHAVVSGRVPRLALQVQYTHPRTLPAVYYTKGTHMPDDFVFKEATRHSVSACSAVVCHAKQPCPEIIIIILTLITTIPLYIHGVSPLPPGVAIIYYFHDPLPFHNTCYLSRFIIGLTFLSLSFSLSLALFLSSCPRVLPQYLF